MGWDHSFSSMRYGQEWRYHRKICHQTVHKGVVKNYHSVMLQKVHTMLDGLLKSPEKFEEHNKMCATLNSGSFCLLIIIRRLSVSIPMKMMYGYDVEALDDHCVITADKSVTMSVNLFVPGATLINIFPILAFIPAWFPGASSHKVAAEVKRLVGGLVRFPVDWAKTRMVCQFNIAPLFQIFDY